MRNGVRSMQEVQKEKNQPRIEYVWRPQPGPQKAFIDCPLPLVGFGGARGGGKSSGVLGKWGIKAETYGAAFNAVFFRKEMPQQDDLIEDAKAIYLPLGAIWYEQKKMFRFKDGGRIRFRSLENDADAEKYQGQNLTDAAVEEAGNYPDPSPIWKLFGALRSKTGVPIQLILTWNPGGPGHWWIKEKFWDPAPGGMKILQMKLPTGKAVNYVFIPSKVTDNRILLANDPEYIDRLHLVGSQELVRAWLEGDMEINMGAFFDCLGARHYIRPFTTPEHWSRFGGYDWGFRSKFCHLWAGISSGKDDSGQEQMTIDATGKEIWVPKGAIVLYREYADREVSNEEQAKRIAKLNEGEDPLTAADPAIFNSNGGLSIADEFRSYGVNFRRADNDRLSGWNEIRRRLMAEPPMLYIFDNLKYLRTSLAALPMDPKKPEDADTKADDHAADALRYLCKQRPLPTDYREKQKPDRMGKIQIARHINSKRRSVSKPTV